MPIKYLDVHNNHSIWPTICFLPCIDWYMLIFIKMKWFLFFYKTKSLTLIFKVVVANKGYMQNKLSRFKLL